MALQTTLFVLATLLFAGYAVFDGLDLGVGVLYPTMGRNSGQKAMLRAAVGPLWDGNELWLIAGAGVLFAGYPPVYETAVSGFWVPLLIVLAGLVLRAVTFGLAGRDRRRQDWWDAGIFIGSLLPASLLGLVLGNIVRGVPLGGDGAYAGSIWGLLNPFALLVGFTGLLLFMTQGAAWVALRTEGQLRLKAVVARSSLHWLFLLTLAGLTVYSAFEIPGRMEHLLARPIGWLSLALVVGGIVGVRRCGRGWNDRCAFIASSATVAGLIGLAATGTYPLLVPARGTPPETAVAIVGAAASNDTLMVLLIVTAVVLVLLAGYRFYVYRALGGKVPLPATALNGLSDRRTTAVEGTTQRSQ